MTLVRIPTLVVMRRKYLAETHKGTEPDTGVRVASFTDAWAVYVAAPVHAPSRVQVTSSLETAMVKSRGPKPNSVPWVYTSKDPTTRALVVCSCSHSPGIATPSTVVLTAPEYVWVVPLSGVVAYVAPS
jgi:lipoprotein-anchoring transpeptidase ErfK/SrfK